MKYLIILLILPFFAWADDKRDKDVLSPFAIANANPVIKNFNESKSVNNIDYRSSGDVHITPVSPSSQTIGTVTCPTISYSANTYFTEDGDSGIVAGVTWSPASKLCKRSASLAGEKIRLEYIQETYNAYNVCEKVRSLSGSEDSAIMDLQEFCSGLK